MTAEESQVLQEFEAQTRQLILSHRAKTAEIQTLNSQLADCQTKIAQLESALQQLQEDYAALKTAKIIEIESGDGERAQKRISQLVREIDKCIALLNV